MSCRNFLNLHSEINAFYAVLFAKLPYYFSDISVRNFLILHTEIVALYAAVLAKLSYYFSGDELEIF